MQTEKLSKIIEISSKIIALFGTLCIGFSVIYDSGYLYGLGLSLREVPTSFPDHLRSAIIWLPYTAIYVVLITFAGFYFGKKDAITTKKNNITLEQKDKIENIALFFVAVSQIGSWVMLGDRSVVQGVLGLGMLTMLCAFITKKHIPSAYQQAFLYSALAILGACLLFAMATINARSLINEKVEGELFLKNKDSTQVMKGVILRRFENSLIIMNDQHIISIVNPDDLARVNFIKGRNGNKGFLCNYFNKVCPVEQIKSEK